MIRNPEVLTDLSEKLAAIAKLSQRVNSGLNIVHGTPVLATVPEHYYNIAFILAYEALEDALLCLRREGAFACASDGLYRLMQRSQPSVAWLDFATVDDGRDRRNKLAHEGQLVANPECLRFIATVDAQLRAWGVA
jgi:hypothetical protein